MSYFCSMFGMKERKTRLNFVTLLVVALCTACANIGSPDGGPFDETPPVLLKTSPALNSINQKDKKIELYFDEYVKIQNASEKIVISPPQIEPPKITTQPSKKITITLQEDLQLNMTYSIDFSDAIVDNNEGNPFGSYSFTFATGGTVDTLQVAGYVLEAENLDPVKGIYVGVYPLYEGDSIGQDSAFFKTPLARISRTDGKGFFNVKGLAPGSYQVVALQDGDQNFLFNQRSEKIAFYGHPVVPSTTPATRNDTIWKISKDSILIDSIRPVEYTRFLPDNLILRAFKEDASSLYYIKSERLIPQSFQIYFSAPSPEPPRLKGLNFDEKEAFLLEKSTHNDTLRYWLKDTLMCRIDTLKMAMEYFHTDTAGVLSLTSDTLLLPVKTVKARPNAEATRKKKKKDEDEEPAIQFLPLRISPIGIMDVTDNIRITFDEPIVRFDTTAIHLEEKDIKDSVWREKVFLVQQDSLHIREYVVLSEWNPEKEYRMIVDSASFYSIYGTFNTGITYQGRMRSLDDYASLFLTLHGLEGPAFVDLLSDKGKMVRREKVVNNKVNFYFVRPGKYYVSLTNDRNNNGRWDTGIYPSLQPEEVYFNPQLLELRALWDIEQDWNIRSLPFDEQKPLDLRPKETKTNQPKNRNATRRAR